jgi:LuxR family transcriptional regulator, maltose regulon positive regulatory protein
MAATIGQTRILQRRRIIERPRLLALLDDSQARVRTLVAPAGYGKTTLAEHWVGSAGRRGAWFTARRASADVAALALGLARASVTIVEGCDHRLREHLRAVPAPADRIDVLAELLGEDLHEWPEDSWLVIDEYQEISRAAAAERFVSALVGACPIRLLIASRQRPSWVTTRGILYGEVLEINQTALAMDAREAAEVLAGRSPSSAAGLVALANGWPAVIGLASVLSPEIDAQGQLSASLYGFFAEEVLSALGESVRAGLATLSIAPVLDRDLAAELLGDETEEVCEAALDVGVLVERGQVLDLHPLARSFLEDQAGLAGETPAQPLVETCVAYYRKVHDWDAAFDVIARRDQRELLEPLLAEALDDLLDTARLSTIETWCALADDWHLTEPIVCIARAEVALRHGRHAEAQMFAEVAATGSAESVVRALSIAGRAAHLASHEEEALEFYRRAEASASTEAERRDARWGQLVCATELELPDAPSALAQLNATVVGSDARDLVRSAAYTLSFQVHLGTLDLSSADSASELLHAVNDPLIEASFQNVYAAGLALAARYDESRAVSKALRSTVQQYRLDFAIPYALCAEGVASAGLRNWDCAERRISEALRISRAAHDAHAERYSYSLLVRLYAQQGRHEAALLIEVPELQSALPSSAGEVLSARALALVSAARIDEAADLARRARGTTKSIEVRALIAAVDAICALKRHDKHSLDRVGTLMSVTYETGALDLLVTAYRSSAELLTVLLHNATYRERVIALMRKAGDDDLAGVLGFSTSPIDHPWDRLTPREREVYELLCQGLSNRQVGDVLFISEKTAKLHAHHIFAKFGVHSRAALAMQALLDRTRHATSATGASDSDDS